MKTNMKYLSLFSGIGGFEKAIHDVFSSAECVGFSEIDKYALQVYQKHFPTHKNFGDISKIDIEVLPDFDLLVGGFPCTDLSIAKKDRQGLKGKQSKLFWNLIEILKKKKPRYFIFENVNSMARESREEISRTLGIESVMINASLVSGQNRKRLFWVGEFVGNKYEKVEISQPQDKGILLKDILEPNTEVDERMLVNGKSFSLTASYNGAVEWNSIAKKQRTMVRVGTLNKGGQGDRIYSTEGKSVNLSANGGGRGAKTGLYAVASRTYPRYKQEGIEIRKDEKSNALTSVQGDSMIMKNYIVRKLTPTECERLQCFDDGWTDGISNTQRYKCLGNAVCVEVIKHIINCL